ncbi:MAG: hypothetical protein H7067_20070, partial [Burkholderiales bacterium]|nr:hypothetical protein [Opitutaceae bacterium]
ALAYRLERAEIDPASRCAVAGLAFGRAPASQTTGRLVIGDAHALIPPFTGDGMAMAFQSAALALDPLLDWTRGERDWSVTIARIHERLTACFRMRLGTAAALHPFLLGPRAQSGLAAAARVGLVPVVPLYHALH